MRALLVIFVLLCSTHSQDTCPFRLLRTEPWSCERYNCTVQGEITLTCRVRTDGPNNIRWLSSSTSDWEAGGTLYNGTSELGGSRRTITSKITIPPSAGYWWCEVSENEEVLLCPQMPVVHIFWCSCETESAECPSSRDECDMMGSNARCSLSTTSDSFCLAISMVEQMPPGSSDSMSEITPIIGVATRTPTFRSPRRSESVSETKTTSSLTTRMLFQTTYVSTTTAITTPLTSSTGGSDMAVLKLLPIVAPVVGVIGAVTVFAVLLVLLIACLSRIKRMKHHNDRTDTEEHIYDTVKMDTLSRSTTDDQHYTPTLLNQVSTATAADYEEPITALRAAGHKRPQMESVNPVCLEMYGSIEDCTLNDQAMNDS